MKKALKVIIPAVLLICTASPALAYSTINFTTPTIPVAAAFLNVNITDDGGTPYGCPDDAQWSMLSHDITAGTYSLRDTNRARPITRNPSMPNPIAGHVYEVVIAYNYTGGGAAPDLTNSCGFGSMGHYDFATNTFSNAGSAPVVVLPPPPPAIDSSVIMASVVAGVQNTGPALWPLITFMGVLIAFWIATMAVRFIRHSVANRPEAYKDDYTAEQRGRIVNKIKELGDRDSFDE